MIKKIILALSSALFLFSCATVPTVLKQNTEEYACASVAATLTDREKLTEIKFPELSVSVDIRYCEFIQEMSEAGLALANIKVTNKADNSFVASKGFLIQFKQKENKDWEIIGIVELYTITGQEVNHEGHNL